MRPGADPIETFVAATIAELVHRPQDEVVPQTALIDLDVDSLATATLVTFVEAEYGCTFMPAQLTTLYSAARVEDVVLAIRDVVRGTADPDGAGATALHAPEAL